MINNGNRRAQNRTAITTEIVAAYVSRNPVPCDELPALIADVHDAIVSLSSAAAGAAINFGSNKKLSAAEIRKSVRPEAIVSLIDGRSYKTLKRHLAAHGLNPHSYRKRYGLPSEYPMVAASYSARRSEIAKEIQFGFKVT